MGTNFSSGTFLSYMINNTAHEMYHEYEKINSQSPLYSNFEADAYMFGAQITKQAPQDFGSFTYENFIAGLPSPPATPTQPQNAFHASWINFLNGNVSAANYKNIINNFLSGSKVGSNYSTYSITINGVKTVYTVTNNPTVMPLFFK